jgi:hypothetical protein
MPNKSNLPDALLLMAPGCTYCPTVLQGMTELLESGKLGRLEVINLAAHPEIGQQIGTRSVPWSRVGPFELEGVQTPAQLAKWALHAKRGTGLTEYFSHLLGTQRPHKVATAIAHQPDTFSELLSLLEDTETPMTVRIGIGVVIEDLHGNPLLSRALPILKKLANSTAANVRADAAHYLGLTQSEEAGAILEGLLQDENQDVREIAAESLAQLTSTD